MRIVLVGVLAALTTAALPATASAAFDVSPPAYDWGTIDRYQQTPQHNFTFTNNDVPVTMGSTSITGPQAGQFQLTNDGCSGQFIDSGNSCSVSVYVSPQQLGPLSADLVFDYGLDTVAAPLSANASAGTLNVDPNPIAFNPQPWFYGSQNFNVNVQSQNFGVNISDVEITGPDEAFFSINYGNCAGNQLFAWNNCNLGVGFNPNGPSGPAEADLEITSDSPDSPLSIPITADSLTGPISQLAPGSKNFGPVALGSSSAEQTFTLTNVGDFPDQIQQVFVVSGSPQSFPITDDECTMQVVMPSESCTFKVAFSPVSLGEKEASVFMISSGPAPVTQIGLSGRSLDPPGAAAVVDGDPRVGEELDCKPVGANGELAFEWLRDGDPVAGADQRVLLLGEADFDARMSCRISATNDLGTVEATSPQTAPVAARDLAGDPHSLVDPTTCRVVQVDPIPGVDVSGGNPATPESPLTFSARKRIDVELGTLAPRSGKKVRFSPRQLAALADGSQPVEVGAESGQAVLAPCSLGGRVDGSNRTRATFALSGATALRSGEIRTPKLTIRPGRGIIGEVSVFSSGRPNLRFPVASRNTVYNGIRVRLQRHAISVSGLLSETSTVEVNLERGVVRGRRGPARASASLQGAGDVKAAFRTAWR